MAAPDLDSAEFFNVTELTEVPGIADGVRLSRFPSRLEPLYFAEGGKMVSRRSTGCEVRFRTDSERSIVRLSSEGEAQVQVFQGDYWLAGIKLEHGRPTADILLKNPGVTALPEDVRRNGVYAPELMRVVVENGLVYFHGIDAFGHKVEKPHPGDAPAKRWLSYGSSITQSDRYGYNHTAAQLLGVDVLNKGMSGSCAIEPAMVDFLAHECGWDFVTMELGINVRGCMKPEEFEKRVKYLLDQVVPLGKPIVLISIFPNGAWFQEKKKELRATERTYQRILEQEVEQRGADHLHFVNGDQILGRYPWLRADLVHPTHTGHAFMGQRLAKILSEKLDLPLLD